MYIYIVMYRLWLFRGLIFIKITPQTVTKFNLNHLNPFGNGPFSNVEPFVLLLLFFFHAVYISMYLIFIGMCDFIKYTYTPTF